MEIDLAANASRVFVGLGLDCFPHQHAPAQLSDASWSFPPRFYLLFPDPAATDTGVMCSVKMCGHHLGTNAREHMQQRHLRRLLLGVYSIRWRHVTAGAQSATCCLRLDALAVCDLRPRPSCGRQGAAKRPICSGRPWISHPLNRPLDSSTADAPSKATEVAPHLTSRASAGGNFSCVA